MIPPAFPDPLPIAPLRSPFVAQVRIPGSKSVTNRALYCAALAEGVTLLHAPLSSADTQAMRDALRAFGVTIEDHDPALWQVSGTQTLTVPAERIWFNQSGTTSRFVLPLVLCADRAVTFDGAEQLRSRPMGPTLAALASLGCTITPHGEENKLPVTIAPPAQRAGAAVTVAGDVSSQFISGLLLVAPAIGGLTVRVPGELKSAAYVHSTMEVMAAFGAHVDETIEEQGRVFTVHATPRYRADEFFIEPDASGATYFWAAAAAFGSCITTPGLGVDSSQPDTAFLAILQAMGAQVERGSTHTTVQGVGVLNGVDVDMSECSDAVPTLAAIAPYATSRTTIRGVGFIRNKESDRIGAVVHELRHVGVNCEETADGMVIEPLAMPQSPGSGGVMVPRYCRAVMGTYDDHRLAMAFAVHALGATDISIENPQCVAKTFPNFFTTFFTALQTREGKK